MAKTKPKDYVSSTSFKPRPTDAVENIQKIAGIRLSERGKRLFEQASACYIADQSLIDQIPRRSAVTVRLKKLIVGTEKYLELLKEVDDRTRQLLSLQSIEYAGLINLNDTQEMVSKFLATCESMMNEIPQDRRGPTKKLAAFFIYVRSLEKIYEESTDQKVRVYDIPYKDPTESSYKDPNDNDFVKFVKICLSCIGYPIRDDEESYLPRRIRQALSKT
jgi:hypothetical protein